MAQIEGIKATVIEKAFNDLVSKFIYASFEDIKSTWNGDTKFIEVTYQNYKNLCLPKANRKKLTPVFSISTEVKQILVNMFVMMIHELRDSGLDEGDSASEISIKAENSNADCLTEFMFRIGSQYRPKYAKYKRFDGREIEPCLLVAADEEQYFYNRIVGQFPEYKAKLNLLVTIAQSFIDFLKAIARLLSRHYWYTSSPINKNHFLGVLMMLDLNQSILDELQGNIRKAKPKKAPVAVPVTGNTPANANVTPANANVTPANANVTPANANVTPANANVTPATDNTPAAENQPVNEIRDILNNI